MAVAVEAAAVVAWALATLRWLRVAQREHYLAGSATRFAGRWWGRRPPNPVLAGAGLVAAGGAAAGLGAAALVTAAVVAAGPVGLGLRGRTSPLRWTARLRRLGGITAVLAAVGVVAGHLVAGPAGGAAGSVALAVLAPVVVDVALALASPLERRLSEPFVRRAQARLDQVRPSVVAITGSYGKTSTKEHVRHLLSSSFQVVASPASFNNRLGLARAVNDQLAPGVDVFVAEMGTYGKGEIAELCSWMKPTVSVLTAVGPVHLERFGTLEAVARAKSEIFDGASAVVVNGDDPEIAKVVPDEGSVRVLRYSVKDRQADVFVDVGADRALWAAGRHIGRVPDGVFASNVAAAVGVALALDVDPATLGPRLAGLGASAHRQDVAVSEGGVTVIDDTYNSNPAGAAAALDRLVALGGPDAKRILVTPGMVELGPLRTEENAKFARRAAEVADHLVVVGYTNRRALLSGASAANGTAEAHTVADRTAATAWVRQHAAEGDVVLYENDLPDHYP